MIAEKQQFLRLKFGNTSSKIYRRRKLAKHYSNYFIFSTCSVNNV